MPFRGGSTRLGHIFFIDGNSAAGAEIEPADGRPDMFKKLSLAAAALTLGTAALAPTAASAQSYGGYHHYYSDQDRGGYDGYRGGSDRRGYGYDNRGYDNRGYDNRGYDNGRYYARNRYRGDRCRGNTGTIIGAIAGGLLGNSIAGRGDRTLGAVLGAGAGALAGHAI
jgi:hypothetical protein